MDLLSVLELLFQAKSPASRIEVLLLFIHAKLVEKGFKVEINGEPSVMPPSGWNSGDVYEWSYKREGDTLLLKGVKTDDELFVNLQLAQGDEIVDAGTGFSLDEATSDFSHPKKAFRDLPSLSRKIDEELIEPLSKKKEPQASKFVPAGGRPKSPPRDPLRVGQPRRGYRGYPEDDRWAYGRGDIDPLGRGGGGMIMDPFRRGRPDWEGSHGLPRGAVPPGARFDPVGPMNPDVVNPPFGMPEPRKPPKGLGIPDPDHMQPPGFGDNFF